MRISFALKALVAVSTVTLTLHQPTLAVKLTTETSVGDDEAAVPPKPGKIVLINQSRNVLSQDSGFGGAGMA
jgi:hypothetical protein